MKSSRSVALIVGAVGIITVTAFHQETIRTAVRGFSFLVRTGKDATHESLRRENESLRAEIAAVIAKSPSITAPLGRSATVTVSVFSRYPFNDTQSVVIDAGMDRGMRVGMPVLTQEGALFGSIRTVKKTQSEVQTIFDSQWKSVVVVGAEKVKALFSGGTEPMLELIPRRAAVKVGDRIVAVDERAPYGVALGTVARLEEDAEKGWQRAVVTPAFIFDTLNTLLVVTNFP